MAQGRSIVPKVRASALVADDDVASREFLAGLLGRLGCEVRHADTGEAALAEAQREVPDIVVLDVHLPGTSGYEVCRELRDAFGDSVPIILVAENRGDPSDEVAGLLLGADHYLFKPVRADQFLACARRRLGRSPGRPAAGSLTPRELEVLEFLVRGRRRAEIASELCITPKTTATHIEHILAKLGAHSQAQAVAYALRDGLARGGR